MLMNTNQDDKKFLQKSELYVERCLHENQDTRTRVYTCKEKEQDRVVCVKAIQYLNEKEKTDIIHECQIMARCSDISTSVPAFYYRLENPQMKTVYLVYQYIGDASGKTITLTDYIHNGNPNDNHYIKGSLYIFMQVCRTVMRLHDCKIVHKDLKPDNIVLRKKGFYDEMNTDVFVIDFGLTGLPRYKLIGTGVYRAPEVKSIGGGIVPNYRADIFAMGIILYTLLMKREPLPSDFSLNENDKKHWAKTPQYTMNCEIKKNVNDILRKLWEYDPNERYRSLKDAYFDIRKVYNRVH